jgi:hypothetical protein
MHNVKDVALGLTIAVMATNIIKAPEHTHYHTNHEPGCQLYDTSKGFPVYGQMDMPLTYNPSKIPVAVGFSTEGVVLVDLKDFLPLKKELDITCSGLLNL